jgi:hypothetical protein
MLYNKYTFENHTIIDWNVNTIIVRGCQILINHQTSYQQFLFRVFFCVIFGKKWSNIAPVHTMEAYRSNQGKALFILNLGASWCGQLYATVALHSGKGPPVFIAYKVRSNPEFVRTFWRREIIRSPCRIWISDCPAPSLVWVISAAVGAGTYVNTVAKRKIRLTFS